MASPQSEAELAPGHRRARAPALGARLRRLERRQHQRPSRRRSRPDHADQRLEGVHDARDDGRHRSHGPQARRRAQRVVRAEDAPRRLRAAARRPGGRALAPAARDRVRGRRHRARQGGARRGDLHARQHPDRRLRHAIDGGAARPRSRSTSRRTTGCCWPTTARSRSAAISTTPTTRWRPSSTSRRSAWWRARSGASACSRATKCTGSRGSARLYGISAPAPICTDATGATGGGGDLPGGPGAGHRRPPAGAGPGGGVRTPVPADLEAKFG